ncbi:hypothetical protein AURDEDRAFT_172775 [Auricularia subglabra TFB-10046 SS5]|nr:hypothetical protein AURDEDRAFT_172775 [Auricularia subglabra TFB-10046 SS5]
MSDLTMSEQAAYFQAICDMIEQLMFHRYTIVAAFTALVWDSLIALDLEIECIWMTRDDSFKIFWAFLRYSPLIGYTVCIPLLQQHIAANHVSQVVTPLLHTLTHSTQGERSGVGLAIVASAVIGLGIILTHFAFVARAFALYGRDRRILIVLVPLVLGEAALLFYIIGSNVPGFNIEEIASPHRPPKVPEFPEKKWALIYWGYQVFYDSIIFALTAYKSFVFRRANLHTPLLHVLIRDGCGFFVAMIGVYALCIVLELVRPRAFFLATHGLTVLKWGSVKIHSGISVIVSVIPLLLSQRLILNLRHVPHGAKQAEQETFDNLTRPQVSRCEPVDYEEKFGRIRFTTTTLVPPDEDYGYEETVLSRTWTRMDRS